MTNCATKTDMGIELTGVSLKLGENLVILKKFSWGM
jgi:hypothetical protein